MSWSRTARDIEHRELVGGSTIVGAVDQYTAASSGGVGTAADVDQRADAADHRDRAVHSGDGYAAAEVYDDLRQSLNTLTHGDLIGNGGRLSGF